PHSGVAPPLRRLRHENRLFGVSQRVSNASIHFCSPTFHYKWTLIGPGRKRQKGPFFRLAKIFQVLWPGHFT
ncbi:MAG TPA: hypothetical protein PKD78_06975, partial [Saprospiraceae bacterium]|nr:hypothetical protein [Saprospiraceae bacterium]